MYNISFIQNPVYIALQLPANLSQSPSLAIGNANHDMYPGDSINSNQQELCIFNMLLRKVLRFQFN